MTFIQAIILDPTHLELSQPISAQPGREVLISISEKDGEDPLWREASKEQFLKAYDEQDAIYDQL